MYRLQVSAHSPCPSLDPNLFLVAFTTGKVEDAVAVWNNSTLPNGWRNFEGLTAYATLTPGSSAVWNASYCFTTTVALSSSLCPNQSYVDEAVRFQSVKQLAFCAYVPYTTFVNCDLRVRFTMVQGGSNATLTALPDLVNESGNKQIKIRMQDIRGPLRCHGKRRCFGSGYEGCKRNCSAAFGGTFDCATYTCTANAWISDLSVKVNRTSAGSYAVDASGPVFSKGGAGGTVLPAGYSWLFYPGASGTAPLWQYDGMAWNSTPANLSLTLRPSSDPWLTYMAATKGSGYFDEPLPILGGALVGIGGLLLLGCFLTSLLLCVARWVARRYPERPPGCLRGCMWRMGRGACGPKGSKGAPTAIDNAAYQPQHQQQLQQSAYPPAYPPVAPPVLPSTPPPPGAYPYPYPYAYGAYPAAYTPGIVAASPQQQQQAAFMQAGGYAYTYPAMVPGAIESPARPGTSPFPPPPPPPQQQQQPLPPPQEQQPLLPLQPQT
ncbi:hypothetical protein Agub_g14160 [Astrephomene gubernaculifera]|uniref:Uncharacterized protein n=1 Tax=Astrephomene gubernaculifera TaxID=47775 RepID=A0AAD3E325_9CHLO|nr:hypothetical protein Agub_g14160 [Astrephomene gubernaculifera]